jgi:hypothetical protein
MAIGAIRYAENTETRVAKTLINSHQKFKTAQRQSS